MNNKTIGYTLIGAAAGIAVYLLWKSLNESKRKAEQEEALKAENRKKFSHEYGEYTL